YTDDKNVIMALARQNRSDLEVIKNTRHPCQSNKNRKPSQARAPTRPVVANPVGTKPLPPTKLASQRGVSLISGSLYKRHASMNLLGPIPTIGSSDRTCFKIGRASCRERGKS